MKGHPAITLVILLLITTLSSCVTRKKLSYLNYQEKASYDMTESDIRTSVTPSAYKIMPHDNLYIRVITPDPQWSALFNTMPVGAGGAVTEASAGLFGYLVDINGYIDIPFVGSILVGGKTLAEVKSELDITFKSYVADAAITIRIVNNYVSIIGEVNAPGRYPLVKDRINVFEALSMAGDMSPYANRQKVQLIRPSPYGPVIKEFSLADRSILSSEMYYVMPNDIIYALPARGRPFQVNASVYSLFLSSISTVLVIFSFIRTITVATYK